jgi:RNA polymerase sigma factor (sigma-70 family)
MSMTDQDLCSRRGTGRHAVAGAMFERHATAVYNHCFRHTADWAAAQDLTAMVFLEIVRRPGRVRFHDGSALPWLLATATNLTRNHARSGRRLQRALARSGEPASEPDFAGEASERLDDERRMRAALDVLRQLPQRERDVFALCALSGLTYEQAGFALGVPTGTIRSRLSRARARLRDLTADDPRPEPELAAALPELRHDD